MMEEREVRMRCIEAAAKNPLPSALGYAQGVVETAELFFKWIVPGVNTGSANKPNVVLNKPLGLPKKGS